MAPSLKIAVLRLPRDMRSSLTRELGSDKSQTNERSARQSGAALDRQISPPDDGVGESNRQAVPDILLLQKPFDRSCDREQPRLGTGAANELKANGHAYLVAADGERHSAKAKEVYDAGVAQHTQIKTHVGVVGDFGYWRRRDRDGRTNEGVDTFEGGGGASREGGIAVFAFDILPGGERAPGLHALAHAWIERLDPRREIAREESVELGRYDAAGAIEFIDFGRSGEG